MTTIHLWSLIYGAAGMAVLYTFFPKLAEKPSGWLRSFWAWIKAKANQYGIGIRRDNG